jgi:hypothetical protein
MNLDNLIDHLKDEIFLSDYRRYVIWEGDECSERTLRASTRRQIMLAKQKETEAGFARERAVLEADLEAIRNAPTTADRVDIFYGAWEKHRRENKLLIMKSKIIDDTVALAKQHSWDYGVALDDKARRGHPFDHVIYVDTPHGQVSWHVSRTSLSEDFPAYTKAWSGLRDSRQVLQRLWREYAAA